MFTRKPKTNTSQVDEVNRKKCAAKVLDIKKDLNSRLRYLKSYIETTDNVNELKQYFDQNYSQIFSLFYESFVTVEANIKHRYNKQNKDELDTVLFVFLKILVFQPERLHLRWQVRSIGRIIQKLINSGNTKLIKFSGTRLFLIWYQILNSNKTHVEELMFQKLIQGFDTFHSSSTVNTSMGIDLLNAEAQKVFSNNNSNNNNNNNNSNNNNNNNDLTLNVNSLNANSSLNILTSSTNSNTIITALSIGKSIYPYEITPIIPIQPNEQQQQQQQQQQQSSTQQQTNYNNITSEMLKEMLEYMQQDCMSIEWQGDKHQQSQRCYEFLFDEFKRFYLCYMFPNPFMQNNNSTTTPSTVRHLSVSSTSSNFSNSGVNQYSLSLNVYSNLDLLTIVNEQPIPSFEKPILSSGYLNDERKLVQLHCKEEIIKWLISVLQTDQPILNTAISQVTLTNTQIGTNSNITESAGYESMSNRSINTDTLKANQEDIFSSISDQFDSSLFDRNSLASFSTTITAMSSSSNNSTHTQTNSNINKQILQKVILSSNLNVNLVHEILRNTYFLNFETPNTVQQVLNAYKKWFLKESNMPSFMQEPFQSNTTTSTSINNVQSNNNNNDNNNLDSPMSKSITDDDKSISGISINSTEFTFSNNNSNSEVFHRTSSISSSASLVNDLFHQNQTRIGYMKCLQIFFFHSSNLLLNKTNLQRDKIKNICCYTLEIYKLFIRKIKMDYYTWTMLITILLRVAEFLFNSEYLVNNRNDPTTSHLIKLITETVLLAIVKASFSFNLNIELWDQLMSLLSSVSSNSDVIDKWIEIIDDLIRQVLKSCYNIDINNLPTIETDKRKLKKKTLYPTNNDILVNQSNNLNPFLSNINSQQIPIQTKPRSKTEIFSSQSSASTTTLVNSPIASVAVSSTATITNQPTLNMQQQQQQQQSPQTKHISPSGTSNNQKNLNNNNNNNKSNSQISMSQLISSTVNVPAAVSAVQPLLSRQRNMTVAEIESTKSPSLSDEHFLGVENNSKKKKLNSTSNKPNNKPKKFSLNNSDLSNQDSSNQEDENDDSYDKSSTLKAINQYSSVSATTSPNTSYNSSKPINKHNSEKSIYFSSELLTEQNNNNNNININDNDSSNSSNSQTQNLSFISSSPPLPPLPMLSNFQFTTPPSITPGLSKFSPPFQQLQQHPQQPPPLPPLPPELASKYALNKTALNLDTIESKNCDTSSIDSDNNNKTRDLQFNNACSDVIDVFYMNNSNAQNIDTPSEVASMSGGDLSGEIYASPISNTHNQVNGNYQSSENSITPPPPSSSSSFVPTLPLLPVQNNLNEIYSPNNNNNNNNSLLMSTLNNTDNYDTNSTNNGLLSIDHRNNDERGGSFIESKYISKDSKSKGSTLTASTTLQDINQIQSNRNTGITPNEMQKVNNVLLTNTFESMFKETANCLIKRLFGCLGNVNAIKDPLIHKKVFEFIYNKWDRLNKIKDNFKLTDLSQVVPSITYFSPWLFEAIYQLSNHYQSGKLIAYKTICRIGIKSSCYNSGIGSGSLVNEYDLVSDEFMDLFYLTIHQGLHSEDKHIVNCIIQNCGTKFWHCMLPSCTLLLKDFIVACANIDKDGPKYDASSILGCLIGFPDYFGDMHVLTQPAIDQHGSLIVNEDILSVEFCSKEDLKNLIIQNITNFSDDIFNTNSRCVILCALTCFIYEEILNQRWHPRLNDAIRRIFKDLDFREQFNPVLVKMSCDNLRFLSILANLIFQYEIQYAINIINELNQCLVKLINTKPSVITEDYEKAIIANMFALLEWCMSMPLDKLKDQDRATLLRNNFKLIIHICNTFKSSESSETEHIHLAARFIIHHLLTKLNHFPFGSSGPSKIVSSVNETSDLGLSNDDELSAILFEQPNLQFFTLNNQFLISFVELPIKGNEQYFNVNQNLKFSSTICRFIVRDFCGKNCWDCCVLQSPDESLPKTYFLDIPFKKTDSQNEILNENIDDKSKLVTNKSFDYTQLSLIDFNQIPKDLDILDNILKYISYSSPECRLEPNKPLNLLWDLNANLNSMLKLDEVKQKLINQTNLEQKQSITQHELEMQILETKQEIFCQQQTKKSDQNDCNNYSLIHSHFNLCKSFVHQIGLLSWEKRQSFNLLKKTPQLLRELKSLDDQTCRETHKIALIYIAEGQDEKISILSNERGSQDYEDFLSMLAWSVDLETHEGFMGGLQHNYQMKTAPYYANSICEVLFHVSTQINNQNDPNKISKWRHLGNDSVQIIWSEHSKDYDRNILATEFADVIICIYPLKNGLYRIQITKKSSVGYFGPLFDGAIINKQALPTLIRATAINASRVLLSNTKGYQDFFVHRAHSINNIIKTLTEKQTFEQFIADIYSPASNVTNTGLSINTSVQSGSMASAINNNGFNSNTYIGLTTTKKENQDQF